MWQFNVPKLLTTLLPFTSLASSTSFPSPLPLKGSHVYVHDPSLIQRESDGKYYLFSSHNKAAIITATELAGPWTQVGSILPNGSSINLPGKDDIWAPDVSFRNGTYYAYYAVSQSGSMNSSIGLATSSSLDPGTWTDLGEVFETKKGEQYNAIDPTSTVDENGKPVLTWGSYWENIFQFNLTGNSETVIGSPKQVAFNSTIKGNNPRPVEGSFLWPHGDFYYLFFSSGQCCNFDASALPPPGTEYKVFVGRSRSAHGPFVDANGVDLRSAGGTLMIASHGNVYAPGGEGVFSDKSNGSERDVFVYHYLPASGPGAYTEPNASVGLNGIDWSTGWPVLTDL